MNNKLDVNPPIFALSSSSYSDLETDRRLIVLVPDSEADTSKVGRKIWELANALEGNVQFLGLCRDETREPSLRRQMIALTTMVGDGRLSVEWKIAYGSNWLDAVKSNWREGDVIACFAEQYVGFVKQPLSKMLESRLNATVYLIAKVQTDLHANWLSSAIIWMGSMAIIALFFWGQAKLIHMPQDWAHTLLLYLSLFAETGSIWAWNSLFG